MPFLKTEKICYSNIMGQNSYSIPPGIQVAKSIEKFWSADKWNY